MIRRRITHCVLCILAAACAPVPQKTADDGSLKELGALPSVIIHEPSPQVHLENAIAAYQALLDSHPDVALHMAAMRRMADLRLELADLRLTAGQSSADSAYGNAIGNYLQLITQFPDYRWIDEVRYQLARAYDAIGQPQRAMVSLTRLVKDHPDSRFVAEAHFRRGEILFTQGSYADAEEAYRSVVAEGSRTAFYEQAVYKLGWTLLQQGQHMAAVDMFVRGLDKKLTDRALEEGLASLPRTERELVDDSLRAVALAFAFAGATTSVADYWTQHGERPYEHLVYKSLAETYRQRGRLADAAQLYRDFVERHPMHIEAPHIYIALYELYDQLGSGALAWRTREEFVQRYRPDGKFWRGRSLEALPAVGDRLRKTMSDLARRSHARWQTSARPQDMEDTIRRYHDYLRFFPADPGAPDLRFLLGELLYEHGDYADAAKEYERFAYSHPMHPRAADAAYTALLAYEELLNAEGGGSDAAEWRSRLTESALSYAARFPRHPQVSVVLTKVADELFELGAGARARAVARRVIGLSPPASAEHRRAAWRIIGHVDFDGADYASAEHAYRKALAVTPAGDEHRAAVLENLAAAVYHQGEQARAGGQSKEAVEHFLRVGAAAPGASIVATAEYDAAALLLGSQEWGRAADVLERLRVDHPNHELALEATRKLAVAYLESGRLAEAANEFERMARESTDGARGAAAWWQAGELYAEAGRPQSAATAYKRYLAAGPESVESALEARFRLARLAEARGDVARQRYWLNEIVAAADNAGRTRSDAARAAAAEAALALAEPLRERYEAIPLSAPLKESLTRKKSAMEQALEAYGRAAEQGIAGVTTAATYHISELYHDFSRALLDSQRPADLTRDELMEYDVLLEEQAYPFEERAIQLHQTNWRRVGDGIYDRWVQASLDQLAELLPVRYGKSERREHVIDEID